MKRRTKIRIVSFTAAVIIGLIVWGTVSSVKLHQSKVQIELSRQRALIGINEALDTANTALTKAMYTGSPQVLNGLLSDLTRAITSAKLQLSTLSTGEAQLYSVYKALTQAEDYTASLFRKVQAGETVTKDEQKNLQGLLTLNTSLLQRFNYMSELYFAGQLSFEEMKKELSTTGKETEGASYMDFVVEAEDSLGDYPTLVYDGPFSDQLLNKESRLLKQSEEISLQRAKQLAAKAMGAREDAVTETGKREGKMPCYTFRYQSSEAAITVNGGYLLSLLTEKTVGEQRLTESDAVERASAYLYQNGYAEMRSTYYAVDNGICTVNFAYVLHGVICYPDLIKVGVDMNEGTIVSLEASDYIMNHYERTLPEQTVSAQEATNGVADTLSVKKVYRALIPKSDGTERFTLELLCEGLNGQDVLLYVNAQTGKEEELLLLLYSDNGTLTK